MRPYLFFARALLSASQWGTSLSIQLEGWYSGIMLQFVPPEGLKLQRPLSGPHNRSFNNVAFTFVCRVSLCALILGVSGSVGKELTGSELMSLRGLGACNSMLPSIEFYMSANSPAHNDEHLISPFFDPPSLTMASGQMDGRGCIHFFNCAKLLGVRKGTQC